MVSVPPCQYVLGISSKTRGKNPANAAAVANTMLVPRDLTSTGKIDEAMSGAFSIQNVDTIGSNTDIIIQAEATPPYCPISNIGRARMVHKIPPNALVHLCLPLALELPFLN